MEAYIADEEATRDLHEIVRERDELRKERNEIRIELRCAKTAVVELENQNLELDRMLRIAHSQLSEHVPKHSSNPAPKIVIGSWLASPEEYPGLCGAEDMWRNGHLQQALSQMPTIIEREDFGVRHQINARLLLSAIIQSSSHNLQAALQWAEEALRMASQEQQLLDLSGKAQFHRGLCYYYLGEYANAKWCLSLASHLEGHEQWVLDFQQKVEQYLQDLPEGDPKQFVSAGFKFFCHPKLDFFVYNDSSSVQAMALPISEASNDSKLPLDPQTIQDGLDTNQGQDDGAKVVQQAKINDLSLNIDNFEPGPSLEIVTKFDVQKGIDQLERVFEEDRDESQFEIDEFTQQLHIGKIHSQWIFHRVRRSIVDVIIARATVACILQDYKVMESHVLNAVEMANVLSQTSLYASLLKRCQYLKGVALYYQERFQDANDAFENAGDCPAAPGLSLRDAKEWRLVIEEALQASRPSSSSGPRKNVAHPESPSIPGMWEPPPSPFQSRKLSHILEEVEAGQSKTDPPNSTGAHPLERAPPSPGKSPLTPHDNPWMTMTDRSQRKVSFDPSTSPSSSLRRSTSIISDQFQRRVSLDASTSPSPSLRRKASIKSASFASGRSRATSNASMQEDDIMAASGGGGPDQSPVAGTPTDQFQRRVSFDASTSPSPSLRRKASIRSASFASGRSRATSNASVQEDNIMAAFGGGGPYQSPVAGTPTSATFQNWRPTWGSLCEREEINVGDEICQERWTAWEMMKKQEEEMLKMDELQDKSTMRREYEEKMKEAGEDKYETLRDSAGDRARRRSWIDRGDTSEDVRRKARERNKRRRRGRQFLRDSS